MQVYCAALYNECLLCDLIPLTENDRANSLTSGGFQPLLLHVVRGGGEGGDHEIVEYHVRVRLILHHV